MIVAPNSPTPRAKPSTSAASTPGIASGTVIVRNTRARPAPNVRAACSNLRSTPSSPSRIPRTISGSAITPAAIAAPVQRNRTPPDSTPKGPPGAKARSSTHPVTTGGTTSGRCTTPSSSTRPGNRNRASIQASANATGSVPAHATPPTSSDSRTTSHSAGDRIKGA